MAGDASPDSVIAAIRHWQTKVLQLDRRNGLLYFPAARRGVRIVDLAPDELLTRLGSSRAGLSFPLVERVARVTPDAPFDVPDGEAETKRREVRIHPGDLTTDLPPAEMDKRLAALRKKDREWEEEQGLNVLFVAFGFLTWVDEDDQSGLAPLLLLPADLERKSPRDPFRLHAEEDEELVANPTLRHKLANSFGIDLPDFSEGSIEAFLFRVSELIGRKPGWKVEPTVILATFPFSKLAIWEDLNRIAGSGATHPMVRTLAGDARADLPETGESPLAKLSDDDLKGGRLDDLLHLRDQYAVIDADFSQLRAIELTRAGANLVIHGPPGTGKSQTIANVIATLLADGKRVLFVSEKTAALDVVKRRLTDVGLGKLCLDLHSERGKKASVYGQIREALQQERPRPTTFPFDQLRLRRQQLNSFVRQLHQRREPLGLSVHTVQGRLAEVQAAPRVKCSPPDVAGLTQEALQRVEEATNRIARRPSEFQQHRSSPWRQLRQVSSFPGLGDQLRDALEALDMACAHLIDWHAETAPGIDETVPLTTKGVDWLRGVLELLDQRPSRIQEHWLQPQGLAAGSRAVVALGAAQARRTSLVAQLKGFVPGEKARAWLGQIQAGLEARGSWTALLGSNWEAWVVAEPEGSLAYVAEGKRAVAGLREASVALQDALGVEQPACVLGDTLAACELAESIVRLGRLPSAWCDSESLRSLCQDVDAAEVVYEVRRKAESDLLERFDERILEHADPTLLTRLRTDHRSWLRWFRPSFHRDMRVLKGMWRMPEKLSVDAATHFVEVAGQVNELRSSWSTVAQNLMPRLESRFRENAPNWQSLKADLQAATRIRTSCASHLDALGVLQCSEAGLARLGTVAAALRSCSAEAERALSRADLSPDRDLEDLARELQVAEEMIAGVRDALEGMARSGLRPTTVGDVANLLRLAGELADLEATAEQQAALWVREFGPSWCGWETDAGRLERAVQWVAELLTKVTGSVPEGMRLAATSDWIPPRYEDVVRRAALDLDRFRTAMEGLGRWFDLRHLPWAPGDQADFRIIQRWCRQLAVETDKAADWLDYRRASLDLAQEIGSEFLEEIRGVTDDATSVPAAAKRHLLMAWLDLQYHEDAALRVAPRDLTDTAAEFRKLDAKLPYAARARVLEKCLEAYPGRSSLSIGELGVLQRELSKKRKLLPVRKLIAQVPNVLPRLKPCFMMSPLAVSQFLPSGLGDVDWLGFDVVVFDEASQVFPEDAVPALARGRQCVVVGDQQQLPPSNFFRTDDGDGESSDDETSEDRLIGVESVLDVLVGLGGAGVEAAHLKVHYRSQHDDLIKFSNHYFYDDRLLTFPAASAAAPGFGLRARYVPHGRFDAGASRTNRAEAEEVVELVFDLMERRPSTESIGVVALSRAQADLIEDLVAQRRLTDRRFEERFAEDGQERFFVKNLENVQGDERDHIILSIGYGPTKATGLVPNRFGPLNAEGGHRRLNVAVSRARRSTTVVHSLLPEHIHSDAQGARLLKRYLEFLQLGTGALEAGAVVGGDGEAESPFEEVVGRALEARGYRIRRQVGCAKYWIDLVVEAEDGGGFDLAIECDGATYHRSPSARDRDRIRQETLERLGWRGRIHRIWSTAWIRNPQGELEDLEKAIQMARARPRESSFSDGGQQRKASRGPEEEASEAGAALSIGEAELGDIFPRCKRANLVGLRIRSDLREETADTVAKVVKRVVEVEGPVHLDVVVERVREYYQLQRAGKHVRAAVVAGVAKAVSKDLVVRWNEGSDGKGGQRIFLTASREQQVVPRGPYEDGAVRTIGQISVRELRAGIRRVVEAAVGARRDEVVSATARAFGYGRTGGNVEQAIGEVLADMLASGHLQERMGSVILPEE